jgi:succinate dehydrogenase / fumarate reductase iron-sulfur subunit
MDISVSILRFDPEEDKAPRWETYELEADEMDRVLDVLHKIKWYYDGSLTFRRSCAHGICGSDAMVINNRNALACKVLVQDVAPNITIQPLKGLPVIKDLVVDMEPFFESYRSVMPYLINDETPPHNERLQTPEERDLYEDTTKCILCAACTTSCPVFWSNGQYVGPAAIVNAHRFIFDSRDKATEERLAILAQKGGVFSCRTAFECTEVCPREIHITRAISEVKRAILELLS